MSRTQAELESAWRAERLQGVSLRPAFAWAGALVRGGASWVAARAYRRRAVLRRAAAG